MELQGERLIAADRATVWQALNDADVLRACIPGCDELEKTAPDRFEGKVTQKVGPVKATLRGAVTLSDVVEGESYRIDGEGKGGAAGFAKGGADVTLSEGPEGGTRLAFDAEVRVGGKLAQLGNRLIDGFARKMADQFFDRFKEQVEGPGGDTTPGVDEASAELVAEEAAPAVAIREAEDGDIHPAEAPGAAGPTTRDEPVTGASAAPGDEPVEDPVATQAGAGVAGGTDGAYQAARAKKAAELSAAEASRDADPEAARGKAGARPARARSTPAAPGKPPVTSRKEPAEPPRPPRAPRPSAEHAAEPPWKRWFRKFFG